MKPSFEQLEHFFRLVTEGRVTAANFQAYLEKPGRYLAGLPVTYNCDLGLVELIKLAVGKNNLNNINSDITQERFPLRGTGIIKANCRVEPVSASETKEQAAARLVAAGHILADTGDLAGFQQDHPDEMEKWGWVYVLAETARWAGPGGGVLVPGAGVSGANRNFYLDYFRDQFNSGNGVLVRCE
ncbi:MAG: hypothetical protein WCX97_05500 [Candidatus Magasanikbacteria bacterium]